MDFCQKKEFVLFAQLLHFLLVNFIIQTGNCAHIVFYHQVSSYSHRVTTYPLADALEKRGHQVTYISPFHPRGPYVNRNITEVVPKSYARTMQAMLDNDLDINNRVFNRFSRVVHSFYPVAEALCEQLLESPEFQEWTSKMKSVDLLIMDNCMSDCGLTIAYKYRAKHIFYNTVVHLGNEYDWYGFPLETSAIPELEINPPQTPMSFMERVFNTLISIHFRYVHYNHAKVIDAMVRKYLKDPEMPFLDDMARNASLVFYTGDVITDFPRSHPPQMVNLGGIYCSTQSKELPQKLKSFIEVNDTLNDGFVYISLGSIVKTSELPTEIQKVFFHTVESFPRLQFLWKWDGPMPQRIPKNLYLAPWFPQTDVLAHPRIRSFVNQGGRPSTLEGLCHAVPFVMFPVLGDQDVNARRMNKVGGNVLLELGTVTLEELQNAINRTVYDVKMKERLLELRNIILDKPMTALETGVWHTEYVLRHKDTSHLRSASFHQYWFQRRLIDVWFFLFSILLVSSWLFYSALKCFRRIFLEVGQSNVEIKKVKKK